MTDTMQLSVSNVSVAYGRVTVVEEVGFGVDRGQIACLLGPSGCGKTSLLRAIAGFEPVASGEIHIGGRLVAKPGLVTPPEDRNVGMVFQDFALFPHLDVADNIGFGLRHLESAARKSRIRDLAALVGLQSAMQSFPHQLSGGQQQRVALARAMAPRPDILLLDEPFSGIDAELREQLAWEIRKVLMQENITAILVTHDQMEAFAMADIIGVMGVGRLRQMAPAYSLYHEPADRFVADFIGQGAMIGGMIRPDGCVDTELGVICAKPSPPGMPGDKIEVLLRPDDILHDDDSPYKLPIVRRTFRGSTFLYTLGLPGGGAVLCQVHSFHDHAVGEELGVRVEVRHMAAFPAR
ncbi:MAG: ABC transporter ATP-binding protein [Magnetospiraceae bacterium]